MFIKPDKNSIRQLRHRRIRYNISGSLSKPRLVVFRSLKNIYAQIVNDENANNACNSIFFFI